MNYFGKWRFCKKYGFTKGKPWFLRFFGVFLDFEVWVKDFKVFDLRILSLLCSVPVPGTWLFYHARSLGYGGPLPSSGLRTGPTKLRLATGACRSRKRLRKIRNKKQQKQREREKQIKKRKKHGGPDLLDRLAGPGPCDGHADCFRLKS